MADPGRIVDIEEFLHRCEGPIFDVRSPCEFASGHIPGSTSLPLFTDDERAFIGTMYKQQGHDAAVTAGLHAVGPKLGSMATSIRSFLGEVKSTACRVTCFRGGMRSRSVQWLCEFIGFPTVRLDGGYKSFRHHVLQTFERPFSFIVIGGKTGSGKTEKLKALKQRGHQTVDLEALAGHRGSAFGLLPGCQQPTTEQFENLLAQQLWSLDPARPIFVEDESRPIGSCLIPKAIFDQMDRSRVLWLEVGVEERLRHIMDSYGALPPSFLIECTNKLHRRLGGERVQRGTRLIEEGAIEEAAKMLLEYYDGTYLHSRSRRQRELTSVTGEQLFAEAAILDGLSRSSQG